MSVGTKGTWDNIASRISRGWLISEQDSDGHEIHGVISEKPRWQEGRLELDVAWDYNDRQIHTVVEVPETSRSIREFQNAIVFGSTDRFWTLSPTDVDPKT